MQKNADTLPRTGQKVATTVKIHALKTFNIHIDTVVSAVRPVLFCILAPDAMLSRKFYCAYTPMKLFESYKL